MSSPLVLISILIFLSSFAHAGNEVSIEKNVGQMLVIGFEGTRANDETVALTQKFLNEGKIGGVILYKRNIVDPVQLMDLTKFLNSEKKYIIAVDQEGGLVQRLSKANGFFDTPKPAEMRKSKNLAEAYEIYLKMAENLHRYGINYNFGPVVDLNDQANPSPAIGKYGRSFAKGKDDSETVIQYASEFIKAHRKAHVSTSLKHFPGHGLAQNDTHDGFTDIAKTFDEAELSPFYSLIDQGLADSIMSSHLTHTNWDTNEPVSLSSIIIKDKLRNGPSPYNGVIVSDDLGMGAITKKYGDLKTIVIKAVKAGNDLLIFSSPFNKFGNDFKTFPSRVNQIIQDAIKKGEISEEDLKKSYERINLMKKKRG